MTNINPEVQRDLDARNRGLIFSGVLHGGLLLFIIFGLPEIWKDHTESLPTAMTMEIVPITEISNLKPTPQVKAAKKPKDETPPKQEKPQPKVKQDAAPPEPEDKPEPEPTPEPKKVEEKPAEEKVKQEKPKPEKAKPTPKKEKKAEPDLDAVLRGIESEAQESDTPVKKSAPKESKMAKDDNYRADLPMGMTEIDAIRQQFMKCWNVPAGAADAQNLVVVVDVDLSQDGAVTAAKLAKDSGRYAADGYFRAAADAAIRAVHRCSPLKNMPPDKYSTWRQMEITFDPKEMLY